MECPRKNTGVGCHFLLQGVFPTQGWNLGLLHCRWIHYQLSQEGITTWFSHFGWIIPDFVFKNKYRVCPEAIIRGVETERKNLSKRGQGQMLYTPIHSVTTTAKVGNNQRSPDAWIFFSTWYIYPAYLIYMQSTSYEMPGWMKHKLESRLPVEIAITSDMQITPPLWQKMKRN